MQVVMGGSGSTGSSLLKNILNRHPDIFSGEETEFFAKKMIKILESYLDFVNVRSVIIKYCVKIGKRCCRFLVRYS